MLCSSPLGTCAQALGSELDAEVYAYRSSLFAESTKQTYTTHRNTYLRFCAFMGYPPLPATSRSICQYAAFLARSLNSYSIPSYLNIVGLMHKEFGLDNPLTDDWHLTSLLKGIKRTIGQPPNQKKPITINMLIDIHSGLNLNNSFDSSFWAICLTAFFGLFRKSHLLTTTKTAFDPSKQFTKSDFIFYPWGALVHVRWSKTIQFRERTVHLPLPRIPHSVLCPVTAILHAFSFTQSGSSAPRLLLGSITTICASCLSRTRVFCLSCVSSSAALGTKRSALLHIHSVEGELHLHFRQVSLLNLSNCLVTGSQMLSYYT